MKNVKILFFCVFMAGLVICNSGCSIGVTHIKKVGEFKRQNVIVGGGGNWGVGTAQYDISLGDNIQTTPIHPNDLRGGGYCGFKAATARIKSAKAVFPKMGLRGFLGLESSACNVILVTSGMDLRYFTGDFIYFREGDYKTEKQKLVWDESRVFTHFTPYGFSFVPDIGLEAILLGYISMGIEVGCPYSTFRVRSGYDRWGKWETYQDETRGGFGRSLGAYIKCNFSGELMKLSADENYEKSTPSFFIAARKEVNNPVFAGEKGVVTAKSIMIGIDGLF